MRTRKPSILTISPLFEEASGGITMETLAEYISDDVDIISSGKLTQGYSCVDFSLKIDVEEK